MHFVCVCLVIMSAAYSGCLNQHYFFVQVLQGSVVTHLWRCENFRNAYVQNFMRNMTLKKF